MYEIDKVKLGEFISELRKEKEITQKELASRLYISDKAISKWETGHSVPDITLLIPLAEILGVTVTELLECRRIEGKDTLDVLQTDNLVKKVIGLSEEENMGRPQIKKKHVFIYLGCAGIALVEMFLLYLLRDKADMEVFPDLFPVYMMMGMMMFFGIYFWFFMKEKLPAYYDEQKVNVYVDGVMHMNLPGVYFNNRNWPHMVRAFRMWSSVGMIVLPIIFVIFSIVFSTLKPLSDIGILLVLFLGSLFIPPYLLGKKYQYEEGEQPEKRKGNFIKLAVILLAIAALAGVLSFSGMGTMRSATRMGCVENADRNSWSASYMYLDGFMQRNIWTEDDSDSLKVLVETKDGTLEVEIKDEDGNVVFHHENMETGIYEVKVSGKCVVRVTAKEHKGSFCIGD